MKKKIKKALDLALQNVSSWVKGDLAYGDARFVMWLENEEQVAERVVNVRKSLEHKKATGKYNHSDGYEILFSERVPSNSICFFVECWRDDFLNEVWYFVGDRSSGFTKMYYVYLGDGEGWWLRTFPIPDGDDEFVPVYRFVQDVVKAFMIKPLLFEKYYDFQVTFFGDDDGIDYTIDYIAEYECVDV